MPLTVPAMTVRLPPHGQRLAPVCVLLSAVIFGASLALAWVPLDASDAGLISAVQQLLPLLAAAMGLLAGGLCMFARPAAEPNAAVADAAGISGLQSLVRQLTGVLEEEHGQVAAFQEIYANSTREALIVSRRLALLADVALDAETRLVAGVDQADQALRQSAAGGPASGAAQRALPEIADMFRRGLTDQSRTIATMLDAVVAKLASEADGPIQVLRKAVAGATGQIRTLTEAAVTISRDVTAFDTAGRGIATASTTVVSRLNDAVAHVDSVLAQLPEAAARIGAAAEQAAQAMAVSSDGLRADSAAINQAAAAIQVETEALRATRQDVTQVDATALARLPEAAAMLSAAAEQAAHMMAVSSDALRADGAAVQQAAAAIQAEAEALRAARQDISDAGAAVLSRIGDGVAMTDAAVGQLPDAVKAFIAASARTEQIMTEASRILCTDSNGLAASSHGTLMAAGALRREAETLKATGQQMSDAGHQTIAAVTQIVETAVARLGAVIADADIARQGTTGLAQLAATLESAASTLVDGAYSLDAAGNRVALEGEKITERLNADATRNGALLQALPDVAIDIRTAMEALRTETSVLTNAAQKVASAGHAAAVAVTTVAAQVEISTASLDATGRMISATGHEVAAQVGHLAEIAGHTESQATLLPAIAADITAAADRLHMLTEAWRPDAMLTILPEAAARLDAAGPRLDLLHGLSERLETVVAGLEAGQAQEAALATMAVLSTDIGEAVRRVEAALTDHEEAWPAVVASMARMQLATGPGNQAAANSWTPELIPDGVTAALRHLDGVTTPNRDGAAGRGGDERPRFEPAPRLAVRTPGARATSA